MCDIIALKMPEFIIGGVPVSFPFEPYDVQRRYMEKVIESLDKSANSVLESPTGWPLLQENNEYFHFSTH